MIVQFIAVFQSKGSQSIWYAGEGMDGDGAHKGREQHECTLNAL